MTPDNPSSWGYGWGSLGELVRSRRQALGLTLKEVAEKVGCARSYLSMIENDRRPDGSRPSEGLLWKLAEALEMEPARLVQAAQWQATPVELRRQVQELHDQGRAARELAALLRGGPRAPRSSSEHGDFGGTGTGGAEQGGGRSLDEMYRSGELKRLIERLSPGGAGGRGGPEAQGLGRVLPMEVPLINSVAAGYPKEFTDLGFPARVSDEYVRTPDIRDPDAFAARVIGDSMAPNYLEGDIVVFSPGKTVSSGLDCFVRIEPDQETTFKRVYFEKGEDGAEMIRLQPLNPKYAARVLRREEVSGAYAAVSVTRAIGE